MANDDFTWDDDLKPKSTRKADELWPADNRPAPPPELSALNEAPPPVEPSPTLVEVRTSPDPSPEPTTASDDQILADLAVLDRPEPRPSKNVVTVINPPPGDPDDLSLHENIFDQKIPVRVVRHPRGGRRIIVGTGGGIDSYISEVWVQKHPSANAYRPSPGRKIVMVGYNPGLRIRCVVIGKGIAYLKVTEQGLKLVTKAIYDQR